MQKVAPGLWKWPFGTGNTQTNPMVHHSGRGIQYCCDQYQKQMEQHGIQCSMTESYDPYANAVAERVIGILKKEFMLEGYPAKTETMRVIVAQSIEKYNVIRLHLSCGMFTPTQMHKQQQIKRKPIKKRMQPNRVASFIK